MGIQISSVTSGLSTASGTIDNGKELFDYPIQSLTLQFHVFGKMAENAMNMNCESMNAANQNLHPNSYSYVDCQPAACGQTATTSKHIMLCDK
jgi:hypothetical protein